MIVPIYMMFQAVGLLDTQLGLILVYIVANLPIVVWLMYDFFADVPIELEEIAQLDGATRFSIFWDIVLPLTRPGLAATTLLTLILNWNEYIFAVFLSTAKAQTMPILVAAMNAGEKRHPVVDHVRRHRRHDHPGDPDGDLPAAVHRQGRAPRRCQRLGGCLMASGNPRVPVSFDKVQKSFGEVRVLEELNLDVGPGEFLVLLGASGSGKTTALRILSGLETATLGPRPASATATSPTSCRSTATSRWSSSPTRFIRTRPSPRTSAFR